MNPGVDNAPFSPSSEESALIKSIADTMDAVTEKRIGEIQRLQTYDTPATHASTIVAHYEGAIHPLDHPCELCRPSIVITAAMVERACEIYYNRSDVGVAQLSEYERRWMRAALEAALNG